MEYTQHTINLNDPDIYCEHHIHYSGNGMWSAIINTKASTKERALAAAEKLSRMYMWGRETWWRIKPEAERQKNFETQEEFAIGHARFSFMLRGGPEHDVNKDYETKYPGLRYMDRRDMDA